MTLAMVLIVVLIVLGIVVVGLASVVHLAYPANRRLQGLGVILSVIGIILLIPGLTVWAKHTESQQDIRPTGTNLVLDSDFETTTITHDYYINGTRTTEQAHTGSHSWKMTQQPWYPSLGFVGKISNRDDTSQAMRVRPGDKYYMEAWVYPKATNATNVGTGNLAMLLTVRDSTGQHGENYLSAFSGMPPKGQWTKISNTVAIPDGYDLGWPGIIVVPDVPIGDVFYIDNVVVREETHSDGPIDGNAQAPLWRD
jgi:hypothetical protein